MGCNSWGETTACIRDIFSTDIKDHVSGSINRSFIEIYPHYSKYRRNVMVRCGPGGKRGKIVNFSPEARVRMLQTFGKILDYPSVWQDFTLADDVFKGLMGEEVARKTSSVLKKYKWMVEKEFPGMWAIFRREWETRKSGELKGQEIPHFHCLWDMKGVTEQNFRTVCLRLASLWVEATGTGDKYKALTVAVHPNSFRWITNRKMAQNYVSKYVAKCEKHDGKESRGRYWMKLGNVPIEEGVQVDLSDYEGDRVRRLFRKKVGNKKSGLYRALRSRYFATWLFIESSTVRDMLQWIKAGCEGEIGLYAPF